MERQIYDGALFYSELSFVSKYELFIRVSLDSLVFDVENLFYPHGCCLKQALRSLCEEMGQDGPWYRPKVDKEAGASLGVIAPTVHLDVEAKRKIDVKVTGFENDSGKEIFMRY